MSEPSQSQSPIQNAVESDIDWRPRQIFETTDNQVQNAESKLRHSEETLRLMFESATDGIFTADCNGVIKNANQAFLVMHGYSLETEIAGRPLFDFVAHTDHMRIADGVEKIMLQGCLKNEEFNALKKESIEFPAELNASLLKGSAGNRIGFMGIIKDISERKASEARIQHLNQLLLAVRNVNQLITREKRDKHSLLEGACRNLVKDCGFLRAWTVAPDAAGKMSFAAQFGMAVTTLSLLKKVLAHGLPACAHEAIIRGKAIIVNSSCECCKGCPTIGFCSQSMIITPLLFQGKLWGGLVAVVGGKTIIADEELALFEEMAGDIAFAMRDIEVQAEKRRVEDSLRTSEQRLRSLVETTSDLVWEIDENLRYVYLSPQIRQLLGYEPEELIGKTPYDLMEPAEARRVEEKVRRLIEQRKPINLLININKHKNGQSVILETNCVPVFDQAGNYRGYHGMDRDITQRKQAEEVLRKYELLANDTRDIILFLSLDDGAIVEANLAAQQAYGYSRNELLSMTIYDLRAPGTRVLIADQIVRAGTEGTLFETIHLRKDGSGFPVEVSSRGAEIEGRRTLVSVIRDITDRKKGEVELRRISQHEKTILSAVPDIIVEVNLDKVYTWANQTAIDFFGAECVGREVSTYFVGDQDTYNDIKPVFDGVDRTIYIESWQRRCDGKERLLGWWCRSLKDSAGNVIGALSAARDITDQKKAEEKAQRSSREWRATFDSISDMISIQDRDYRITRVNKAYALALSKPFNAIIGKTCFEIVHGAPTPAKGCPHSETIRTGKPAMFESFNAETNTYSEIRTFPIFNDSGNVTSTVHVVHDITQRKREEAERQQLRDKAEMASRLAAVGEMASGIAHEINNPLSGVIGFAELLLERHDLPEDIRADIEIINQGSERVKEIIKRMLTFARQQKPMKTCTTVTDLIDNTLELRKYVLDTANIEVIRDYQSDLPWLIVDPGQLQQVFLNLIVNAEYAMKKAHGRGKLMISARRDEDKFRFSFGDDGPGMADEIKSKLFQPFFTTKAPGEGTGLGLSLSRGIVLEHGGTIVVSSVLGKGSIFTIELPLSLACSGVFDSEPASVTEATPRAMSVLVVDDEPAVRSLLKAMLNRDGHSADIAETAQAALDRLEVETYDVIMADIRMPGMSGIEFFAEISNRWPRLAGRFVFITGDAADPATSEYLAANQIACIAKPFDRKTLQDQIARFN